MNASVCVFLHSYGPKHDAELRDLGPELISMNNRSKGSHDEMPLLFKRCSGLLTAEKTVTLDLNSF